MKVPVDALAEISHDAFARPPKQVAAAEGCSSSDNEKEDEPDGELVQERPVRFLKDGIYQLSKPQRNHEGHQRAQRGQKKSDYKATPVRTTQSKDASKGRPQTLGAERIFTGRRSIRHTYRHQSGYQSRGFESVLCTSVDCCEFGAPPER
jgi:hypothetical protein